MGELFVAAAAQVCHRLGYATPADALLDPRGWTLRSVPWRRTVQRRLPDGQSVFRKLRYGRRREGSAEWRALLQLAELGLTGPQPILFAARGADSVVVTARVPGAAIAGLLAAAPAHAVPGLCARLARAVAPQVARLHAAGWYYRDLYWNHLFLGDDDTVAWIDPERLLRPRWRRRRWQVKDLAGLLASLPVAVPRTAPLRFLRAYAGGALPHDWRRLARAVLAKAARIRAHRPKFG